MKFAFVWLNENDSSVMKSAFEWATSLNFKKIRFHFEVDSSLNWCWTTSPFEDPSNLTYYMIWWISFPPKMTVFPSLWWDSCQTSVNNMGFESPMLQTVHHAVAHLLTSLLLFGWPSVCRFLHRYMETSLNLLQAVNYSFEKPISASSSFKETN